jgi:hypothetical protein
MNIIKIRDMTLKNTEQQNKKYKERYKGMDILNDNMKESF